MQRLIASFMAFLMVIMMSAPTFGQASRYRLPTQAGSEEAGPAPSFRGSERQGWEVPVQQGQVQGGGVQMPVTIPQGAGADTGLGGAAMMGMSYQVHVLGEVMKPGTYRITASDRLSEVINRAGGFMPNGSERNIELKRKGSVKKIDLLGFKLFGRLDDNPYLTDNDVIFVPLKDRVIQVVGSVKRPDFYELRKEKNLADVIDLAGGFNAAAALDEPVRVIRFVNGEKTVEEVSSDEKDLRRFDIKAGDVVVVSNVVTKETEFDYNVASIPGDQVFYPSYEDRVFVLGGVALPGAYPFSPYYTVNQYISLAGGLNDRGKEKYRIIDIAGKSRKAKEIDRVNPGDTVMIEQRWMSPAGWLGFALGVASFGLSASATIIAISK